MRKKVTERFPMSDGSGLIEINGLCKIRILVLIFNLFFFMANTIFLILIFFPDLGTLITSEFCC